MEKFSIPYPVRPYKPTQWFGGNGAYYQQNGINIKGHNGQDLKTYHGQPVYATHDGYAYHQVDGSSGHGVTIISDKEYDYKGKPVHYKTISWHLVDYAKEPKYKSPVLDWQQKNKGKPKFVKKGEVIGYSDNTGLSTGTHLHFGVKPIVQGKPIDAWMDSADIGIGQWQNVENGNGYLGSVDPATFFNGRYADEKDEPLSPADSVAVLATTEAMKGNKTLADQLWAIVAIIKAWLK